MIGVVIGALVVLAVISVAFLLMLDKAFHRVALERAAERQLFAEEREQWYQERQLLLNRVVDPPAGIAQSLAIGQDTFDPSEAHDWEGVVEMPDFPVQGERTLT